MNLRDRALSKLGPALLQIKIRTMCLSAMQVRLILNPKRMLEIFLYLLWYFCYHIQTMQVITVS